MHLPYTPEQAKAAHKDWRAMCGHFSISAATGRHLDWVRDSGVPLKGWMNPGSGSKARPMHPMWARSLRDQCESAGVPFLFKQWGNYAPVCPFYGTQIDEMDTDGTIALELSGHIVPEEDDQYVYQPADNAWLMKNVGKKAAGRSLDGAEHNGYPFAEF